MKFTCKQIKTKIEDNLKGAIVEVKNPREDGAHFIVEVTWKEFENKSLIEQHQIVYSALDEEFKAGLHSLSLKTKKTK